MWLERILEEKKSQGITPKAMSERTKGMLPERTIVRILNGETENPRIDTIIELGASVGLTPSDLFKDNTIVEAAEAIVEAKETLVEAQKAAEVIEAQKDIVAAELEMLRAKTAAQDVEIALLKEKLRHKEELLAVYNYFTKIKTGE